MRMRGGKHWESRLKCFFDLGLACWTDKAQYLSRVLIYVAMIISKATTDHSRVGWHNEYTWEGFYEICVQYHHSQLSVQRQSATRETTDTISCNGKLKSSIIEPLWASLQYLWPAPFIASSGGYPTHIPETSFGVRLVLWCAYSSRTPIASPSGFVLENVQSVVWLLCTAGSFSAHVLSVW